MFFSLLLLSMAAIVTGQQLMRSAVRSPTDRPAAPSFSLADAGNRPVRLSAFRGKPVVVNLWATECGGCKAELPTFVRLDRVYRDKALVILGISMDILYSDLKNANEGWARVKPFVHAHGMKYPIVLDDGSAEKAFNVTALPATYLIDRTGRIAATYIGVVDPMDLETNIKTLLAER
jgi:thiol-disulfide isomerase/thioredoxin